MRIILQGVAVLAFALLAGCATQLDAMKPTASVSKTTVQNISFDSVTLGVLVDVMNPNHFNIPTGKDRKSTRLNCSHVRISYAVFCLKKKKGCRSGAHHAPARRGQTGRAVAHRSSPGSGNLPSALASPILRPRPLTQPLRTVPVPPGA